MNMYLKLLVGAYLALIGGQLNPASLQVNQIEWAAYKLQHGKQYNDPEVDQMRSSIYAHNKRMIEQFNQDPQLSKYYTKGLSHLSDWTEAEIQSLKGLKLAHTSGEDRLRSEFVDSSPEATRFLHNILQDDDSSDGVPDEVDWRRVPGRVSPVHNQGRCGSCWAFSTIGVLEGQEVNRLNSSLSETIELSVQNLLDCIGGPYKGCGGGIMADGFDFIARQGGLESASDYPYTAKEEACRFVKGHSRTIMGDSGHLILAKGDEQQLKKVVARYGPVAVGIDASLNFYHYKSGVLHDPDCRNGRGHLDHAVLVVGYGRDPVGGDYWLVKNSWGADWGDQGYIKMARNKDDQCGVAVVATIATF